MEGKNMVKLAADFSAGAITAEIIRKRYGDSVLTSVLALVGASVAGVATNIALEVLDEHTGIVSGVGGVIDDVFDLF